MADPTRRRNPSEVSCRGPQQLAGGVADRPQIHLPKQPRLHSVATCSDTVIGLLRCRGILEAVMPVEVDFK